MQSAPFGAQCALHAGVTASVVCQRCGNFMCTACSENGAQAQCPSCRSLSAASFPHDASANFETLWSHAWQAFTRDPLMCIVGGVVFFVLLMIGQGIATLFSELLNSILGIRVDTTNPFGNLGAFMASTAVSQVFGGLVSMLVQGVALVGFYRLLLDVLVGKRGDLGRMFSQVHLFARFVGLQVILFFVVTLPSLLYFGAVGVVGMGMAGLRLGSLDDFQPERFFSPAIIGLFLLAFFAYFVFLFVVLPVSLFALPELIVGQCGPLEAVQRAWQLGSGQRLRAFGYSFVAGMLVIAGMVLCCVGLLPALPLATMLLLALFLALRNSAGLPPAVHD